MLSFQSLDKPVATYIEASWMSGVFKSWLAPDTTGLWGVVHYACLGRRWRESEH